MTQPTPTRAPTSHQPGETIDAAEINLLGVVANQAADNADAALQQSAAAAELAGSALQVPEGGLTEGVLSQDVLAMLRGWVTLTYDGTAGAWQQRPNPSTAYRYVFLVLDSATPDPTTANSGAIPGHDLILRLATLAA